MKPLLAILLALLSIAPAAAHTRSESFSVWTVDGNHLIGSFQVDTRRATQLVDDDASTPLAQRLTAHLTQTVTLTQNDEPCTAAPPRPLSAAPGELRAELRFTCPSPLASAPAEIRIAAFRDVSPSHVHFAVFTDSAGHRHEVVLAGSRARTTVAGQPTSDFTTYVTLGFEHVLSGLDHLAFLLALAMLAGRPPRAVLAATGFTVGHSLTLGLTAIGRLQPDSASIEAMIGFTVVWAAWEALARRTGGTRRATLVAAAAIAALPLLAAVLGRTSPPWILYVALAAFTGSMTWIGADRGWAPVVLASAFGLAHGAGFAGALIELELPRDRLLPALLGFNLGVEAAQLAVLAAIGLAAAALRRLPQARQTQAFAAASAALAALGTYWFVGRSLL